MPKNPLAGYCTPAEAAHILDLSGARVRKLCAEGRLERVMFDARTSLITRKSVEAFNATRTDTITCQRCNTVVPRRGPGHLYCDNCRT